jgi:hypothetical protein
VTRGDPPLTNSSRFASVERRADAGPRERLVVYGLRLDLGGDWPDVVEDVARDFAWFRAPVDGVPADVAVEVERGTPDWDALGSAVAAFVTPRNVVYQQDGRTIVDYFGQAVAVLDRAAARIAIRGEDPHLVHEAAYHFLLSRIGEHLDARRMPRLHALALAGRHGAMAITMPSGGGKSTLSLRALADPRVRLLAEDTPLLDTQGQVHPFPLRIGVNPTDAELLPAGSVRRIQRMELHPKVVVDLPAFADRVESDPQPLRDIVIGRRSLGTDASLERVWVGAAAGPLLRECVVGVGVYQGMEFVLQRGMRDVFGKGGQAAMRIRCCAAALRRARVWRLTLGRDTERNWHALDPLMR